MEAIPAIGKILDDVISTPEEKREAQIRLRELDIREIEAKSQVQSAWMNNQSLFVAGAIPSMLWMVVLVVFFNYIISPLMQAMFGIVVPILDLPKWYSDMCSTIILGLFAKKAWDNTSMSVGKFSKKSAWDSNEQDEPSSMNQAMAAYEEDHKDSGSLTLAPSKNTTNRRDNGTPLPRKNQPTVSSPNNSNSKPLQPSSNDVVDIDDDSTSTSSQEAPNYNDPDYINRRLAEMSAAVDRKSK